MKALSKKHWIIIGVTAALLAGGTFFYLKKRKQTLAEMGEGSGLDVGTGSSTGKEAPAAKTEAIPLTPKPAPSPVPDVLITTPATPKVVTPVAPVVKPAVTQPTNVMTTAKTVTSPQPIGGAPVMTFSKVEKDGTKGKAIVWVNTKKAFKVGDTIKITGKVYKGSYKVWYIFTGNTTMDAVYIDTPFISTDSGTVTK